VLLTVACIRFRIAVDNGPTQHHIIFSQPIFFITVQSHNSKATYILQVSFQVLYCAI